MWILWMCHFNPTNNYFIIINILFFVFFYFTFSLADVNVDVSHYSNCKFDKLMKLKPRNPKLMIATGILS